jgi:AraC-like DNA-binding protein
MFNKSDPQDVNAAMKITLLGQILVGAMMLHQIFIVAMLLGRKEARKDHSIAIAAFFAAKTIANAPDVYEMLRGSPVQNGLEQFAVPFLFLLGPAIFFYCRALVSPSVMAVRRRDFLHLVPFAIAILLVINIMVLNGHIPENNALTSGTTLPWMVVANIGLQLMLIGLFLVVTSVYVVLTIRLLARYRRSKFDYFASLEGRSLTWFEWMMGLLTVVWAFHFITLVDSLTIRAFNVSPDIATMIEAMWVYGLSFLVLRQKVIFRPLKEPVKALIVSPEEPEISNSTAKYQRSALDEDRIKRIVSKVERAMSEDGLYRNQNITLRHLSDHTWVSENYLSQVLNERIGRNFYDFVNHWRIKDACKLLTDGSLSVIDIGEQVGFNSRSTFNAAFKKETELTPSEYRGKFRQNAAEQNMPVQPRIA